MTDSNITDISTRKTLNFKKLLLFALPIFFLLLVVSVIVYFSQLDSRYKKVRSYMQDFNESSCQDISAELNSIPYWYRDINDIEKELNMIRKEVDKIESVIKFYTSKECQDLRSAYEKLLSYNDSLPNWNFNNYLSKEVPKQHAEHIICDLYFTTGESSKDLYFHLHSDGNQFRTNLVKPFDNSESFSFYCPPILLDNGILLFRYTHDITNEDRDAFLLKDLYFNGENWIMKLYSYIEDKTYTFTSRTIIE